MKPLHALICLTVLCLFLSAMPAEAKVIVRTSTDYYWVDGFGRNDIVRSHARYVRENHSSGYTAYAQPDIRWEYKIRSANGLCSVEDVRIRLHINYMYPKLRRKQVTADRKWWERYEAELEEHELIHGEIAKRGARAMDDALSELEGIDCSAIQDQANDLAREVWEETMRKQNEYDDLTQHGIKQGRFKGL